MKNNEVNQDYFVEDFLDEINKPGDFISMIKARVDASLSAQVKNVRSYLHKSSRMKISNALKASGTKVEGYFGQTSAEY